MKTIEEMIKPIIKCPCGKEFETYPSLASRKKYCSKKCMLKYADFSTAQKGRKRVFKNPPSSWFKKIDVVKPDTKGYIRRRINGLMTREHRYVVEKHLGRKLLLEEVVHHIDGNKANNNIDNLEVMSKPEHDKLHNGRALA